MPRKDAKLLVSLCIASRANISRKGFVMSRRTGIRFLQAVSCVFILVPVASATDVVHISRRAKIGDDAQLEAGAYRVEAERSRNSAEVLFLPGEHLVEAAHATLGKVEARSNHTEVHSEQVAGEQVMTRIWLQGWTQSLVFRAGTSGAE